MSPHLVGYVFSALTGTFLISCPLFGMAIQRGYAGVVLLFGFISATVGMFGFYIPEQLTSLNTLPYALVLMVLLGLMFAAIYSSCYLVFEKVAEYQGQA